MTTFLGWNPTTIATLRTLWAQGVTINEIGARLGITRNQAIGKAHRLHLPARPSPILRPPVHDAAGDARILAALRKGDSAFAIAKAGFSADRIAKIRDAAGIAPKSGKDKRSFRKVRVADIRKPAPAPEPVAVTPRPAREWVSVAPPMLTGEAREQVARMLTDRVGIKRIARECGVQRPQVERLAAEVRPAAPVVVGKRFNPASAASVRPVAAVPVVAVPVAPVVVAPTVFKPARAGQCCWLDGDDRKTWRQCEAVAVGPERAWCEAHRAVVYVRRPVARVEARAV